MGVEILLGRVVQKPVKANPGLKVNRGNDFSCIKVLSIAYPLCSLRLLMLKNEGQKVLNRTPCCKATNNIKIIANPELA